MYTYVGEATVADKATVEVYECSCGYHFGVDSTFLEQVRGVGFTCPSCEQWSYIDPFEEETA